MYNKISINMAWNNSKYIEEDYYNWILICKKNNIRFIRIVLCTWCINALYSEKDLKILCNIINLAYQSNIEVCIVLNNFVDYNKKNYLDINDKRYSWYYNYYYNKYKNVRKFFYLLDNDYKERVEKVLNKVYKYSNVKYIEIINEFDNINCSNKILINWINQLVKILKENFKNRYIYSCSISNYENFLKFYKKIDCYVDLHFYSFPYESAIQNIEYIYDKQKILYLGEYAKYSDKDFLEEINSKIYFISGLYSAYFYKLKYTPLYWWWDKLLYNNSYIKFIKIYKQVINDFGWIDKVERINVRYNIINNYKDNLEKNKIKDRIYNLIKHPLFIGEELLRIKKFLNKKIYKFPDLVIRKILCKEKVFYYLEVNNDIMIKENLQVKYIIDLMSGEKIKYNNMFLKGNYIVF